MRKPGKDINYADHLEAFKPVVYIPDNEKSDDFNAFEQSFFGEIDDYEAWHDGIEFSLNFYALNCLDGDERKAAHAMLYNALLKDVREEYILGLLELKSMSGLELFKSLFEREKTQNNKLLLAIAILGFGFDEYYINYFADFFADAANFHMDKVDFLCRLKKLVYNKVVNKNNITGNMVRAFLTNMEDEEYLVRYHAYECLKLLFSGKFITAKKDDIFTLIVSDKTNAEFKDAVAKTVKEFNLERFAAN